MLAGLSNGVLNSYHRFAAATMVRQFTILEVPLAYYCSVKAGGAVEVLLSE